MEVGVDVSPAPSTNSGNDGSGGGGGGGGGGSSSSSSRGHGGGDGGGGGGATAPHSPRRTRSHHSPPPPTRIFVEGDRVSVNALRSQGYRGHQYFVVRVSGREALLRDALDPLSTATVPVPTLVLIQEAPVQSGLNGGDSDGNHRSDSDSDSDSNHRSDSDSNVEVGSGASESDTEIGGGEDDEMDSAAAEETGPGGVNNGGSKKRRRRRRTRRGEGGNGGRGRFRHANHPRNMVIPDKKPSAKGRDHVTAKCTFRSLGSPQPFCEAVEETVSAVTQARVEGLLLANVACLKFLKDEAAGAAVGPVPQVHQPLWWRHVLSLVGRQRGQVVPALGGDGDATLQAAQRSYMTTRRQLPWAVTAGMAQVLNQIGVDMAQNARHHIGYHFHDRFYAYLVRQVLSAVVSNGHAIESHSLQRWANATWQRVTRWRNQDVNSDAKFAFPNEQAEAAFRGHLRAHLTAFIAQLRLQYTFLVGCKNSSDVEKKFNHESNG